MVIKIMNPIGYVSQVKQNNWLILYIYFDRSGHPPEVHKNDSNLKDFQRINILEVVGWI
jgi:hypothetical protein